MRAACTRVVSMWLVMQGAWPPIICRVSQSSWAVASRPAANLPHVISTSVSIWWYDDDRASSTSVEPAMLIQQSTTSTKVVRCLRTIRTTVHIVTWKLTWKMSLCRQRSHIHCLVLRSTLTTSSHWGTTYTLSQLCELFLIIVTLVYCLCDCSIWGLMRAPHYWWLCFLDWELILYSILILLLFLLLLGDHFNKAQSSVVLNRIRMKFVWKYCQLESAYAVCCWLLCSSVCQFLTYSTFILLIMQAIVSLLHGLPPLLQCSGQLSLLPFLWWLSEYQDVGGWPMQPKDGLTAHFIWLGLKGSVALDTVYIIVWTERTLMIA